MNRSTPQTLWPLMLGLAMMITFGPMRILSADEKPADPAPPAPEPEEEKPEAVTFTIPDGSNEEVA